MTNANHDVYGEYFSMRNVAPDYYSAYRLPAYLKQVLPVERSAAILDIGCGFGQLLKALQTEGYNAVSGVDVSDEAMKFCHEQGLDVVKIDTLGDYCRTAGKKFDFIVMSHVIEHIEKKEVIETLRAIRTHLLQKGGGLMVMAPNAQANTGCYWAYEDFTHTTLYTAGSLHFVLKSAGFEHVEFIDPLGMAHSHAVMKMIKRLLIPLYKAKIAFWNRITNSSFHRPSPQIFTYELKALAR